MVFFVIKNFPIHFFSKYSKLNILFYAYLDLRHFVDAMELIRLRRKEEIKNCLRIRNSGDAKLVRYLDPLYLSLSHAHTLLLLHTKAHIRNYTQALSLFYKHTHKHTSSVSLLKKHTHNHEHTICALLI